MPSMGMAFLEPLWSSGLDGVRSSLRKSLRRVAKTSDRIGADGDFDLEQEREYPMMAIPSAPDQAPLLRLQSLMAGYQHGDEEAARALIQQVSPLLLRYFLVQAGNRRFADDLVQETWLRIHKARPTYRSEEALLPWIYAIARHTCRDYYRKTRRVDVRERQVEILPEVVAPTAEEHDSLPEMDAILARLPASQREVLVMMKVTGMSIEEVARATSSSVGSVKQKAHRAYHRLRDLLAQGVRGR